MRQLAIADKIFKSPNGKRLTEVATHTIHYGHLIDPKTDESCRGSNAITNAWTKNIYT